MQPKVCVIISTYNRGDLIGKAVESILAQNYKNLEIIIVDDGSTDNTDDVLSKYGNKIKVLKEKKVGRVKARDIGIEHSDAKYISILDSDDYFADKSKIKDQVEFLEKHDDHVLVGGGIIKIDRNGREIMKFMPLENDRDLRERMLLNNMFSHSTVLYRREAFEKIGGYCGFNNSEYVGYLEDWNMWLRLGKIGKMHNLQKYLSYYLEAGQNLSDVNVREDLGMGLHLRIKFRKDYPNFFKALAIGTIQYANSLMPFRKKNSEFLKKIRKTVFKY